LYTGWPCEVLASRLTNSHSSWHSHGYVTSLYFAKQWIISRKWWRQGHNYDERPMENYVWPIEWHDSQWPWVRLKVTLLF